LCRVEPTQRCADFVPLYLHPAPDHRELLLQALEALQSSRLYLVDYCKESIIAAHDDAIDALREALGETNE
jgi:hypothetical protein